MSFVYTENLHPAESVAHVHHIHGHTAERAAVCVVVCRRGNHFLLSDVFLCANIGIFRLMLAVGPIFLQKTCLAAGVLHAIVATSTFFVEQKGEKFWFEK